VFCDFDVLMENILGDGTEQSGWHQSTSRKRLDIKITPQIEREVKNVCQAVSIGATYCVCVCVCVFGLF
jgi:hypothetical protein